MPSKRTPLVSVLVPLYNHGRYIEQCLDSIRDEGWKNIELIVHDDCSPDNSWEILQSWIARNNDTFTNVITEKARQNRGVVGSLNRLIELATGDYFVCPLASDDALLPGSIQARVDALKSRPDWLAVFGDAEAIDDNGNLLHSSYLFGHFHSNKAHLLNDKTRCMELLVRWSVPGPVILYRKEAFDPEIGIGKYNADLCIEDRDIYLRLLAQYQLGYVDQPMARYRLHANNTMRSPKIRIQSMLDRAMPMITAASNPTWTRGQRFVALHTGKALLAHAHRRATDNGPKRLAYSLLRLVHTLQARVVAAWHFARNGRV